MAAQMMEQIHQCAPTKVKDKYRACAREFSLANQFTIISTIDDGNCFFDTLSKAGTHHHIASLQFNHTELRAQLVQYMLEHLDELLPFFISNNNNNDRSPEERIIALGEDGEWDNDDGDAISQIAGDAFRININLFDIKEDVVKRKRTYVVNKMVFANYPGSPTIDILRINDGHYEFLQPAVAAAAPAAAAAQGNSPKTKKRSKTPSPSKKNKSPNKTNKRSPSPKKNSPKTKKKSPSPKKNSPKKNSYTRKGAFQVKSKYSYLLDMTVPQLEQFIYDTFKLKLHKMKKQELLNFISDQYNSM